MRSAVFGEGDPAGKEKRIPGPKPASGIDATFGDADSIGPQPTPDDGIPGITRVVSSEETNVHFPQVD